MEKWAEEVLEEIEKWKKEKERKMEKRELKKLKKEERNFLKISKKVKKIKAEIKEGKFKNKDLNYKFYMELHKKLFSNIYPDIAGKLREIDIEKDEIILDYRSIEYGTVEDLKNFGKQFIDNFEKKLIDKGNFEDKRNELIQNIAKLWQLHYFGEGNTRTTALYADIIANKHGIELNLLKEDISELRNAFVIACDQGNFEKLNQYFNKFISNEKKITEKLVKEGSKLGRKGENNPLIEKIKNEREKKNNNSRNLKR